MFYICLHFEVPGIPIFLYISIVHHCQEFPIFLYMVTQVGKSYA